VPRQAGVSRVTLDDLIGKEWVEASIVILFGAQLNSEIEHQTARDSTVEQDKPLGARGAVMADTVGAAV
jgi:membrane protein